MLWNKLTICIVRLDCWEACRGSPRIMKHDTFFPHWLSRALSVVPPSPACQSTTAGRELNGLFLFCVSVGYLRQRINPMAGLHAVPPGRTPQQFKD